MRVLTSDYSADDWIHGAIRRALTKMSGFALDVRLVSYREPSLAVEQLMRDFG
jgi:hypothetical protein